MGLQKGEDKIEELDLGLEEVSGRDELYQNGPKVRRLWFFPLVVHSHTLPCRRKGGHVATNHSCPCKRGPSELRIHEFACASDVHKRYIEHVMKQQNFTFLSSLVVHLSVTKPNQIRSIIVFTWQRDYID